MAGTPHARRPDARTCGCACGRAGSRVRASGQACSRARCYGGGRDGTLAVRMNPWNPIEQNDRDDARTLRGPGIRFGSLRLELYSRQPCSIGVPFGLEFWQAAEPVHWTYALITDNANNLICIHANIGKIYMIITSRMWI
jgi:hypothetical protein